MVTDIFTLSTVDGVTDIFTLSTVDGVTDIFTLGFMSSVKRCDVKSPYNYKSVSTSDNALS